MAGAKSAERKAFKDYFDRAAGRQLAAQVAGAMPGFDERGFVADAARGLGKLEFAGRVQQFSDALARHLPDDVPRALDVLTRSLPAELPNCDSVTDGWLQWPVGQFIADHGVDYFDESMEAMIELTKRFSSEFAVRPFVERRPRETFARLLELTGHESPHVRRWCSEGTRPRLPWGVKLRDLVADPGPIWPILERLKDDDELYVRRSVANNLNDIAKDHAKPVIERCRRWAKGAGDGRNWIIKQGLRSLIKDGDPGALAVIGFGPPKKLTASLVCKPKKTAIGGGVELLAELSSGGARAQSLLVDYAVHYVRKGGKSSRKVFKWTTVELPGGEGRSIAKKHAMKPTSIRALYPGVHRVELQVNGVAVAETSFRLTE